MLELKSLSNFKTKGDILRYLKNDGCPTNQIKRIDWESCEYADNKNIIEFHNPEDMPEVIDLYMRNGDQWSIGIYLNKDMEIDYITKNSFSIID
tara:strand:+ start:1728 stop:2009 length:282 start_codon:yes stop_codon:yes gene_type:complete